MSLTPRERVLCSLEGEEPDRVPIVIGVSNATGVKMGVYRGLKQLVGIDAPDRYLYDWPELGTAEVDEATLQCLHCDIRGVLDLEPASTRQRNRERPPGSDYIDSWGSGQFEIGPGDWFPGIHPLADATSPGDLARYPRWPDPADPSRFAHVRERAKALAEQGRYAIMGTPWLLFPFERAHAMQGMETFMINMLQRPDFAQDLLGRIAEHCKNIMGHFLDACGEHLDIVKIGDDLGMQDRLLISPKMYREFLKPIHADFIAFIRQRTQAKVLFHSCGDVSALIPDFIEIGVDILNPMQTSAGAMADLAAVKRDFGRDIAFCGGIDTHRILPFGTTRDVRAEVGRVLDVMAPGGNFLLGAVHTVMNDVPPANVLAMVDAAVDWRPGTGI